MSAKNYADTAIQPKPVRTEQSVSVNDLVIADLNFRREHGIKKYGQELLTHNGRDALMDAYQEALDLAVYLRQCLEERDSLVPEKPSFEIGQRVHAFMGGAWREGHVEYLHPPKGTRKYWHVQVDVGGITFLGEPHQVR